MLLETLLAQTAFIIGLYFEGGGSLSQMGCQDMESWPIVAHNSVKRSPWR